MIITCYTDGAYKQGKAVAGFLIFNNNSAELIKSNIFEVKGNNLNNNSAELEAVNACINYLSSNKISPKENQIHIYTDSQYVYNGINEWIYKWIRKRWKNSSGVEIKNINLWKKLFILISRFPIYIHWVRAHDGNKYNEMIDKECRDFLNKLLENECN